MDRTAKQKVDTETALRRKVEGEFEALCLRTNRGAPRTFDDLLEYIVHGFSIGAAPLEGWGYTPEQTQAFRQMFRTLVLSMEEILQERTWYDFLGGIYETQVAGKGRKSDSGQFFTPITVSEFMAAITAPQEGAQDKVCDPCSGSGRMLLAAHAHNPGAVLYATDIDRTCCLMTVVNFIIHGCTGRVTHGDSLRMEAWSEWVVNPWINVKGSPINGIPHVIKKK